MSKVTLSTITSGFAGITALNNNFSAISTAIENTLSRDGTTPNTMSADLDMNGHRVLNAVATAGEGFSWEGPWVTATSYALNNLVSESGNTYICLIAHTSGTFATDLAALKWEILASKGTAGAGTGDMLAANNLSDVANAATSRTNLGLAIGTNVQAYDADLTTWAGVTPGTGVATALAVNVGTDGAPVIKGGALGTPSSGDLSYCTGIPAAIVQQVEATPVLTVVSCSTVIPLDDTIPQNTEGDQVITKEITPTSATNRLLIEFECYAGLSASTQYITALFQDNTVNALTARALYQNGNRALFYLSHEMAAGTTSATTFKIRLGPSSAATAYVNGSGAGVREFGGVSAARLRVTEIKV